MAISARRTCLLWEFGNFYLLCSLMFISILWQFFFNSSWCLYCLFCLYSFCIDAIFLVKFCFSCRVLIFSKERSFFRQVVGFYFLSEVINYVACIFGKTYLIYRSYLLRKVSYKGLDTHKIQINLTFTPGWFWPETLCGIWYYFYSLKNTKSILGGVLLLVKTEACIFIKSNTPS